MSERLYSREEANGLLPKVRPLLERARDLQGSMADPARLRHLAGVIAGNGGGEATSQLMETEEELRGIIAELEAMGIVVRDVSAGLIDFPAERDGEPVYLCWRLDEPGVDHWHARAAGFAGREPL